MAVINKKIIFVGTLVMEGGTVVSIGDSWLRTCLVVAQHIGCPEHALVVAH